MPNTFEPVVAVDDKAKATILDVMRQETDGDRLGLVVSIAGIDGVAFKYSLAMIRLEDVAADDHLVLTLRSAGAQRRRLTRRGRERCGQTWSRAVESRTLAPGSR